MVLSNITNKKNERGFTIVELLIVIVVIAILAAITIVAYSGITARANASKTLANVESAQKVAEAMNADNGYYPTTIASFTTGSNSTKLPAGVTISASAPTSANGTNTFQYKYCGAVAAPAANAATGGEIIYFDYSTGLVTTTPTYVGTGAAGLGVGSGTVCNTWVTTS